MDSSVGGSKALGLGIPEPAETYSRSPHLYADLGIPEGVTGVVRKPKPVREEGDVVEERAERPKSTRSRRRTRGGKADATATEPTQADASTDETAAPVDDATEGDNPARRRRRRRTPAESGEAAATEPGADATESAPAVSAPTVSGDAAAEPAADDDVPAEAKPARRRRRRKPAESAAAACRSERALTATVAIHRLYEQMAASEPAVPRPPRHRLHGRQHAAADAPRKAGGACQVARLSGLGGG